jgi:hypothetical protein
MRRAHRERSVGGGGVALMSADGALKSWRRLLRWLLNRRLRVWVVLAELLALLVLLISSFEIGETLHEVGERTATIGSVYKLCVRKAHG